MNEQRALPLLGEKFPAMEVKTTKGMISLPDEYSGKWFVLFSHPGDFTPVCTTEFIGFEKRRQDFAALNCELIGLSVDQVFSHLKWIEWIKEKVDVEIGFPVIADELGVTASTFGMLHPGKGSNTVRSVFIVDDRGIVRIILHYPQEIGRSVDEVLRAVKALQFADKNKAAMPENWPNNDWLGNKVIIPPANSVDGIKNRLEEAEKDKNIECLDWWFCTRKVD